MQRVGKCISSLDKRSYKVTLQRVWILGCVENCGCFCNQSIPTSNEDIKNFCWGLGDINPSSVLIDIFSYISSLSITFQC